MILDSVMWGQFSNIGLVSSPLKLQWFDDIIWELNDIVVLCKLNV